MSKRFFRRFVPSHDKVRKDRLLARLGHAVFHPNYWHLNRHSVSRGIAIGMFWAFIPLPGQTVFATVMAMRMKGNIGLSITFTWVSNPLTMIPFMYAAYRTGLMIMQQQPIPNLIDQLTNPANYTFAWVWENLGRLVPFIVGSFVLGTLAGLVSYVVLQQLWRWTAARRWKRRQNRRQLARASAPVCV